MAKIKYFNISNYRSIKDAYNIQMDDNLTVLVGKNNEGKSNILKALNGMFRIIRLMGSTNDMRLLYDKITRVSRNQSGYTWHYNWHQDFPISLQLSKRNKNKTTIFRLCFALSQDEQNEFRERIGSNFNEELPIEISLTDESISVKIAKKSMGGRGSFTEKQSEIAQFISEKLDSIYIPAIRPSNLSIDIISDMITREINASLKNSEQYEQAIKIISEQQALAVSNIENNLSYELQKFIPEVKSLEIRDRYPYIGDKSIRRPYFDTSSISIDDGVRTSLEYKGDGIKSLIAIGLMKSMKQGDLTIAIEEPESHLHPDAIRKIKEAIIEISQNNQVIISTHSPILINRDSISSNIIVAKSTATPCKQIKEIREELGVIVSDNLTHANRVLLVEGLSDATSLKAIIQNRSSKLKKLLSAGEIIIEKISGAPKIDKRVRQLSLDCCKVAVFFDNDQAARGALNKIEDSLLPKSNSFLTVLPGMEDSEFEDFLKQEVYENYFRDNWHIVIPRSFDKNKTLKWSDKLDKVLKENGKILTADEILGIKVDVSNIVSTYPNSLFKDDADTLMTNFIDFLENRF